MKRMVISFHPDGTAEHTLKDGLFKPDLGPRRVERMSEILFDETRQKFYVHLLKGKHANALLTVHLETWIKTGVRPDFRTDNSVLWFDSYEEAVAKEIEVIDAMRLKGERVA